MLADVILTARQHAAKIIRPGTVGCRVENCMAGLARAQFLRLRRKTQESIDLSMHEQFEWVAPVIASHPTNVFGGIEPDLGSHQGQQGVWRRAEPDALTLQFGDVANTVPGE